MSLAEPGRVERARQGVWAAGVLLAAGLTAAGFAASVWLGGGALGDRKSVV